MRILSVFCVFLLLSVSSGRANECVSLWIERNTIFDRAGYCFNSALGRGYFDNRDCNTSNPTLTRSSQDRVASIQAREARLGCAQQRKNWTLSTLRSQSNAPAPSRAQPTRPSCVRSAEIYFNVAGRWEIARELDVSGPWYVSTYSTGQQSFLNANGDNCVGGTYSYRYVAEVDDLLEDPVYVYTGRFTIGNQTRRCEISITEHNGNSSLFCN